MFSLTLFTFSKSHGQIANLPVTAVTASGNDGNVPANAFDNNLATRWSNNGLGSWIKADLGSPKTISYVDIAWYRGTTRTNTFDIAVSNDGTTFTNVFHGQNSRAVNGLERFDFPDSNGRFVKVTVTGNTENNFASINEIDIYGSSSDSAPPTVTTTSPVSQATAVAASSNVITVFSEAMSLPSITPSTFTLKKSGDAASVAAAVSLGADGKTATLDPNADLTPGATYTATITTGVKDLAGNAMTSPKTWSFAVASSSPPVEPVGNLPVTAVTASGNDGNVPANAFDNNLATRWSNNGLGSWIKADLGSPKTISYVDIAWYRGTTRTNTFDIAVSNDGTTFTNVFHGQNSRAVNGLERFDFPDLNGRFVKVTVTGNTENNYASINEIDIYGFNKAIEGLPMNKTYDKDVLVIKYFPSQRTGSWILT